MTTSGSTISAPRRLTLAILSLALIAGGTLASSLPAGAQSGSLPSELWQRCDLDEPTGQQCVSLRGIAANPDNGRLYLSDNGGSRVVVFSAWGEFLRTWGWGVVESGPNNDPRNEIQELAVDATSGEFSLRWSCLNATSGTIPFDATAGQVQGALEGLPDLYPCVSDDRPNGAPGDFTVGGPDGGPWTIEFTGTNADLDLSTPTIVNSTLSGGTGASVATTQKGAKFEVCVPAEGDACQAGRPGSDPGQFRVPKGLAVDSAGDVYAVDANNLRVQKFSSDGELELMFGGGVNQGGGSPANPGDVCTATHLENGDACGAGSEGTDPGQLGGSPGGDQLAIGPADEVWVGDVERIQRFDVTGAYQDEIALAGETVKALDVDTDGDLYAIYAAPGASAPGKPDIHKLSPAGSELATLTGADEPTALAVDPDGGLYVFDDAISSGPVGSQRTARLRYFDPAGGLAETIDLGFGGTGRFSSSDAVAAEAITGDGDLAIYLGIRGGGTEAPDYLRAYSPIPDLPGLDPPPAVAPSIGDSFADSVAVSDATVATEINPHFWEDASYYLEYGDQGPCDANPCEQLGAPGIPLDAGVVDSPKGIQVPLEDLEAETTYHFRFVAESGGGGPSLGAGGSFTTFPPAPEPETSCPNQALRSGAGALLPDCRAFELVSPIDKNGGGVAQSFKGTGHLASEDGEAYAYHSLTAFADAQSSPAIPNYLASRDPVAGWSTKALNPPQEILTGIGIGSHFRAHSADLAHSWLITSSEPTPDPAAPAGYKNLYRRDNETDSYTVASTVVPPTAGVAGSGSGAFDPRLHGFAADGSSTVFSANERLVAAASSATGSNGRPIRQLYEQRDGGALRLVSVLPGGGASDEPSTAGGGSSHLTGAVSAEGERIYWTTGTVVENQDAAIGGCLCGTAEGRIYLRVGGSETVAVSESVDSADARFWSAARDGSAALFSFTEGPEQGNLYRFDLDTESATLIAGGLKQVGGFAEDLSAGYLVSTEVLDPGPNSVGDSPAAGEENIFHYEQGEGFTYVATPDDGRLTIGGSLLTERLAQVSPDGMSMAFASFAPLTGYDNTDAATGEASIEVFHHSARRGELHCVSCNPSGARPKAAYIDFSVNSANGGFPAAGWIPGWNTGSFGVQQTMSDDGERLFFDAYDDILPRDTNGKADVYEWQRPGSGECTASHPYYFEQNGGCLHLISSGRNPEHTTFGDATPDGETVFIRTEQSLLAQDPGLFDVYGARVDGGITPPPEAPVPCEGDGCQPPAEQPDPEVPGSEGFEGASDPEVAADCRAPARKAQKAHKQAKRVARKARRAKRKARRAHGGRAKRLRGKAKRAKRKARSAQRKAQRLAKRAERCQSGAGTARKGGRGR